VNTLKEFVNIFKSIMRCVEMGVDFGFGGVGEKHSSTRTEKDVKRE